MKHSICNHTKLQLVRSNRVLPLIFLVGLLGGTVGAASVEPDGFPDGSRVMSPAEIYLLYRDKNWQWSDGVGRMDSLNRRFTAHVDGEKGQALAEGRWRITRSGQMCFDARWHIEHEVFPSKTCFTHRILDGTIYQKREPDGVWYVFRHADGAPTDEARKLVSITTPIPQTGGLNLAQPGAQSPTQ